MLGCRHNTNEEIVTHGLSELYGLSEDLNPSLSNFQSNTQITVQGFSFVAPVLQKDAIAYRQEGQERDTAKVQCAGVRVEWPSDDSQNVQSCPTKHAY